MPTSAEILEDHSRSRGAVEVIKIALYFVKSGHNSWMWHGLKIVWTACATFHGIIKISLVNLYSASDHRWWWASHQSRALRRQCKRPHLHDRWTHACQKEVTSLFHKYLIGLEVHLILYVAIRHLYSRNIQMARRGSDPARQRCEMAREDTGMINNSFLLRKKWIFRRPVFIWPVFIPCD